MQGTGLVLYTFFLFFVAHSVSSLEVVGSDHLRMISEKCRERHCLNVLHHDFDDRILDSLRSLSNRTRVLVTAAPLAAHRRRLHGLLTESSVVFWLSIEPLEWVMKSEDLRELTTRSEHYVLGTEVNLTQFDTIPMRLDHKIFLMTGEAVFEIYSHSLGFTADEKRVNILCDACVGKANTVQCSDPMNGIWERRADLTGITLDAVIQPYPPLSYQDKEDKQNIRGIFPEVFLELKTILHFNYTLRNSIDGGWGNLLPDGVNFSGMVGMLQRRDVDISIAGVTNRPDRAKAVAMSSTVSHGWYAIYLSSRDAYSLNASVISQVFQGEVWTVLAIISLLSTLTFFGIFSAGERGHTSLQNWTDSVALVSRAINQKGYDRKMSLLSSRLLLLSFLLMSILMFAWFRAGFLSKLTVKDKNLPVNSLEELASSDIKLVIQQGGLSQTYFEDASPSSIRRAIWEKNIAPYPQETLIKSSAQIFDKVLEDKRYACMAYVLNAWQSGHYPCKIAGLDMSYEKYHDVFAFQKNSPLEELFNYHIKKLRENGVLYRIVEKWTTVEAGNCDLKLAQPMDFNALFGLFFVLAAGTTIAIVSGIAEKLIEMVFPTRRQRRGRKENGAPAESIFAPDNLSHKSLLILVRRQREELEAKDRLIEKLKRE